MKKKILSLLCFLLAAFSFSAYAQGLNVRGTVVGESGEPLAGVTVQVLGTTKAAMTDVDGGYMLSGVQKGETIRFSFIGMVQVDHVVSSESISPIVLKTDSELLSDVLVVGYSSQKRSDITSAISPIDMSDISTRRVPTVSQALQGQVPGVRVTQSTGAPGDGIEVVIRGLGTLGDNNPLYVVDGVPSSDIDFLSPTDIESMTVLKDAASAAIYGARAANGVVVITTKKGSSGSSSIQVNAFTGFSQATGLPDLMNASQYMATVEKAWNNANPGNESNNPYTADMGRDDFADTDWLDELFETGRQTNIDLTASGGNDKTKYLISGGLFTQDGIVVGGNDKYNRLNFRTNVNSQVKDWLNLGTNVQLSYIEQDKLSSSGDEPGIIRHALLRPPVLSVYKDPSDPTYSESDPYTDLPFYVHNDQANGGWEQEYELTSNPVALAHFTNDTRANIKTFGNVFADFRILRDGSLTFTTNLGIDLNMYHNKAFMENFGDDDGSGDPEDEGQGRHNRPNSLSEERTQELTTTWNNVLKYQKVFNEVHSFSGLLGTEFIDYYKSGLSASRNRYDYTSSNFQFIDYGNTETDLWNGGSAEEWALFSYFMSFNYAYKNKYMATVNFRADASSRFGDNNKWGYFPSFSAGWKMSEENFLQSADWLTDLKIRASYGKLGNQSIPNYAYYTTYSYTPGIGYSLDRLGNEDIKWEETTQFDVGIDFAAFNNKLYFSADYFTKNTDGILMEVSMPSYTGDYGGTYVNAAGVKNNGFEFLLGYRNKEKAFKYNVSANLATLKNEVVELHPFLPALTSEYTRTEPGHAMNSYYGYVMEGIYQNTAEIAAHQYDVASPTAVPGDMKFKDINEDGKINDDDRTYIGNPIPKVTYGINFSSEYKGFDFSFLFQGVHGVDKFNEMIKILDYDSRPFNYTTDVLNAWDGEGSTNSTPRVTLSDNGGSKFSSAYIEDGSYFRLKNIELGYTFKISNAIDNFRVYASAQNVFTITSYKGLDPESTDLVDMGTYPLARTFLLGLSFKF